MKKAISEILLGLFIFSFLGIGYDREFHEQTFFIKYKPNLKLDYKSRIGESDLTLNDLSEKIKLDEILFLNFYENSPLNDFFQNAIILIIPLMFTLISSGLFSIIYGTKSTLRSNSISFIINFISFYLLGLFYWNSGWNLSNLLLVLGLISCLISFFILKKTAKSERIN